MLSNQNRLMKIAESQNILSTWHHRFTRQAWPLSECLETYLARRLPKNDHNASNQRDKQVSQRVTRRATFCQHTEQQPHQSFTGQIIHRSSEICHAAARAAADSSLEPWKAGSFCGHILSNSASTFRRRQHVKQQFCLSSNKIFQNTCWSMYTGINKSRKQQKIENITLRIKVFYVAKMCRHKYPSNKTVHYAVFLSRQPVRWHNSMPLDLKMACWSSNQAGGQEVI